MFANINKVHHELHNEWVWPLHRPLSPDFGQLKGHIPLLPISY